MASPESIEARRRLTKRWKQAQATKKIEAVQEAYEELTAFPVGADIDIEKTMVAGLPAEWVRAPEASKDRVFLYLHGGGYMIGNCETHRDLAAKLSRSTSTSVLVIEYRLAPKHPFPAAVDDALGAYRSLIESGFDSKQIVVGGDSAGGGLALALLLSLRDEGDVLPSSAVLLSPWTDLEGTGESMETRADYDPWLHPEKSRVGASFYIGNEDPRHPLLSPIYADLAGLPPLLVHVGNDEILRDDSVRLVQRATAAHVEVTFKIWKDMWHVFQQFDMPEASQAIEEIGQFAKQKLGTLKHLSSR